MTGPALARCMATMQQRRVEAFREVFMVERTDGLEEEEHAARMALVRAYYGAAVDVEVAFVRLCEALKHYYVARDKYRKEAS